MNVVLVIPPNLPAYPSLNVVKFDPLGILSLASNIADICEVTIMDYFNASLINDIEIHKIVKNIISEKPKIVGFSVNFSSMSHGAKILSSETKKRMPETSIIWGGNYATFVAEELIKKDFIDVIFLHEAENSFSEYINRMNKNNSIDDIDGIFFKNGNEIKYNKFNNFIKDIDSLPIIKREFLTSPKDYYLRILSSRGCPYDCIYCSTTKMWGKKWRCRSPQKVVDEIEYLVNNFNKTNLGFEDDVFTLKKDRLRKMLCIYKKRNLNCFFSGSARIENLDDEMIDLLEEFCFKRIFLGVESGDDEILNKLNRNYNKRVIKAIANKLNKAGINVVMSFMIGMPWEKKYNIKKTFELIREVESFHQIHIFTPLPGTEVFQNPKKYGVKLELKNEEEDYFIDSSVTHSTLYLSKEEIEDMYQEGVTIAREISYKYSLNRKVEFLF